MLQRIQTIWLLLAAVSMLLLFVVPSFAGTANDTMYILYASGIKLVKGSEVIFTKNILLLLSTLMSALISLLNIFNYRNRLFQKRIALMNMLLLAMLSFWFFQVGKSLPAENTKISIGMFLPPLAILFTFLAIRGIRFDEKLIRSADRLR